MIVFWRSQMSKIRKDLVDLYDRLKKVKTFPFESKKQAMQVVIEAAKKAIEMESVDIKPDEKVVVNIDLENPNGVEIHARKVKKNK